MGVLAGACSDDASTDGGDGGTEGCVASPDDELSCEEIRADADQAPMTPACNGGSLAGVDFENHAGIPTPPRVTTTDRTRVGEWSALAVTNGHLAIHQVHRPTGKFLMFGLDNHDGSSEYDSDKIVWYPPAPCTPLELDPGQSCATRFDYDASAAGSQDHWDVPLASRDFFCSAHVNLPPNSAAEFVDPRTMVAGGQPVPGNGGNGGNNGTSEAFTLRESVPDSGIPAVGDAAWIDETNMMSFRWYPTATVLPDAKVLVAGGLQQTQADDEEIYSESVEVLTRAANGAYSWQQDGNALASKHYSYPFMFVLPDLPHFASKGWNLGGKLLFAGFDTNGLVSNHGAKIYDYTSSPDEMFDIGGKSCTPGSSAVMYAPGKVMKFGGAGGYAFDPEDPAILPVSRVTEVLDLTSSTCDAPIWRRVGPTAIGKRYSSAVSLPTGLVFSSGGTSWDGNHGDADISPEGTEIDVDERYRAVFAAELFDPSTETWCRAADVPDDPTAPGFALYRGYHSQSFLLPDGRVFLGAGGNRGGTEDHLDHQLFSPPYLFWGPRPELSLPTDPIPVMQTGQTFEFDFVPSGPAVERVTLVKLSSSTHNWDMEQRFLELDIVDIDEVGGIITVDAPPSTCYATPGPYMLFAISEVTGPRQGGVPSIGQYIQVTGTCGATSDPIDPPPAPAGHAGLDNIHAGVDLRASCSAPASTLELSDFGRTVKELCSALGGCPTSGTLSLSARLVASTTQTVPPGGTLLDQGTLVFSAGNATFTDPLRADVSGTTFNTSLDLGPGTHTVRLCATLSGITGCYDQKMVLGPQLVGPNPSGLRAATIEPRFLRLARLRETRTWQPGNDGVVTVPFPGGFRFPYFGTNYSQLYVGANGGIRFTTGTIPASNTTLPTSGGNAGPHVAALWDDWQPNTSGLVLTRLVGTKFVISWERIAHLNRVGRETAEFQLHLYADGRIELHVADAIVGNALIDRAKSATIGLQRPNGTEALVVGFNSSTWMTAGNRALAFDNNTCIASPARARAGRPCDYVLDVPPRTIDICSSPAAVPIPLPDVATTCGISHESYVDGRVRVGPTTQVPIQEGRATLAAGTYTVEWDTVVPTDSPVGVVPRRVGKQFTQQITVRVNAAACCTSCLQSLSLSNASDSYDGVSGELIAAPLPDGEEGLVPLSEEAVVLDVALDVSLSEPPLATCTLANDGDDDVAASELSDALGGGDGDDMLTGRAGDDVLHGDAGADALFGDAGADALWAGDDDDLVQAGADDDAAYGGNGDDLLHGEDGNDTLVGGPGTDEVFGGAGDDTLVITDICELAALEVYDGGAGNDVLLVPEGLDGAALAALSIVVVGVEQITTVPAGVYPMSTCAPQPGEP